MKKFKEKLTGYVGRAILLTGIGYGIIIAVTQSTIIGVTEGLKKLTRRK
jgi:hypothetical protein